MIIVNPSWYVSYVHYKLPLKHLLSYYRKNEEKESFSLLTLNLRDSLSV